MKEFCYSDGITYKNRYRIIFGTWNKRQFLTGDIKKLAYAAIRSQAEAEKLSVLDIKGGADYIDLSVECDPRINIHKAVKHIKTVSAGVIKENYSYKSGGVFTTKYLICTIGELTDGDISEYTQV